MLSADLLIDCMQVLRMKNNRHGNRIETAIAHSTRDREQSARRLSWVTTMPLLESYAILIWQKDLRMRRDNVFGSNSPFCVWNGTLIYRELANIKPQMSYWFCHRFYIVKRQITFSCVQVQLWNILINMGRLLSVTEQCVTLEVLEFSPNTSLHVLIVAADVEGWGLREFLKQSAASAVLETVSALVTSQFSIFSLSSCALFRLLALLSNRHIVAVIADKLSREARLC